MKRVIVADSSANVMKLSHAEYVSAPMRIIAGDVEYVDNGSLEVAKMVRELKEYKGKSSTACPGVGEWIEAFSEADEVFAFAITSKLSGAYNAAMVAKETYEEENEGRKVFVMDSLSTGPELELLILKCAEYINEGLDFDTICEKITEYSTHTHLMFSLESLSNFVKNGRVKPATAAVAAIFGIRIVGQASMVGDLDPMNKCRGEKNALATLWNNMVKAGYEGGRVCIRHTYNPEGAERMADIIRENYPHVEIKIAQNKGLCAFYAEPGGVLVGFEGGVKEKPEAVSNDGLTN